VVRRLVIVLFALVLLVSGANVALALSKPDHEQPRTLVGPGSGAVASAVSGVRLALGYDHRTLDAGLRRATAVMTPAFGDDYRATFRRTAALRAQRRQEVTEAVVRDAGLVRVVDDRAVVLVFADQRLLATGGEELTDPRVTRRTRLRVTLTRVDGDWLLSGLDPL
jgi:Mce-associated membrane protein